MPFVKTGTVPPENALNAVLYCRYSSTQQTENSIDGQLRECRRFADYHGYKIIGEYIDRAKSGTSVEQRDDFLRMVGDAKKQQFAFVIVYRFDRFARNRYDSVVYKRQLAISGVRVISATEAVADGPDGAILEAMYEAMDESYSRRLSAITLRGIQEATRKGIWCSAIPFGYRTEDKRLIIDEKEATAVREIYTQYAEGKTKSEIAKWLNDHGYRTRHGKQFTCNNFNTILSNPAYTGRAKCRDIDIETPAIIDKELYETVQKKLAQNAPARGKKTDKRYFALTGKLYCGLCGCAMISDLGTSQNGTVHGYYSCSRRKTSHGVRGGKFWIGQVLRHFVDQLLRQLAGTRGRIQGKNQLTDCIAKMPCGGGAAAVIDGLQDAQKRFNIACVIILRPDGAGLEEQFRVEKTKVDILPERGG